MQPVLLYTGDGSPTLVNTQLNATYHSRFGAIRESMHIYIDAGLNYAIEVFGKKLNILEIGFGTGLNALLSFQQALRNQFSINYTTVEKYPVKPELAEKLNYPEHIDPALKNGFITMHSCAWQKTEEIGQNFSLTKYRMDVTDLDFPQDLHLVYYDAFAPSVSPDMWKPEIFERLSSCLVPKGGIVTFCAKGEIKRRFRQHGFLVESLKGPPGKREMVRALKL